MSARHPAILAAAALAMIACLPAAEPAAAVGEWAITVEWQRIALPFERAMVLAPQLQDETKRDAALAEIQREVAAERAEVRAWVHLSTRSGSRAVSETIEEFRYPFEWQEPTLPVPNVQEDPAPAKRVLPPTTFETRNVGTTLEVEPVADAGGKHIEMHYGLTSVRFAQTDWFVSHPTPSGLRIQQPQPRFHCQRVNSNTRAPSGQWLLASVQPQPDGRLELWLLRATTRRIAAHIAKP